LKKLLLFNPINRCGQQGLSATLSRYPPNGLGIIAALTPNNWSIEIVDENYEDIHYPDADLVGITSLTSTATEAYRIATIYKERKIPVILGGIHVSMLPMEAIKFADAVVIGEAETSWPQVMKDFENKALRKFYFSGIIDPAHIPVPARRLYNPSYVLDTIQASRGCPYNCDFCSVTLFNGKKYRTRPIDNILQDIKNITTSFFWFGDDNLFGNNKVQSQVAIALFKEMVRQNIKKYWLCFASCRACINEELLEWAAKAGCVSVFLGIESEAIDSLKTVNKVINNTPSYPKVFALLHKYKITVLAGMIFGFDNDTPATIKYRTEFIIDNDIDSYFVSVLTPLPGTQLFETLLHDNRLLYTDFPNDWSKYNWTNLLFRPSLMTLTVAENAIRKAYEKLYHPIIIEEKYNYTLYTLGREDLARITRRTNNDCRDVFLLRK
jgi:radical SAM superfamily enzyme YgiQ (UPF0313 family)